VPATLLAHRPGPRTNVLNRSLHSVHFVSNILDEIEAKEEEGMTRGRTRGDGEEIPDLTEPRAGNIW